MDFYLGTHEPSWLGRTEVPLFISRRRLARLKRLPRALGPWALDSGGFTELTLHGRWVTGARSYVAEVRRWSEEIGQLRWAACQDWMCEPFMLNRTGLSVSEHQRRTIDSYRELRDLAPDLPWVPVLQGWTVGDYWRHVEAYAQAGVDLGRLPLVGLGSVCRRQSALRATALLASLAVVDGLSLHGFGFKLKGLEGAAPYLASADSLAWSYHARRRPPLPGCSHKSCVNCLAYALRWRLRVEGLGAEAQAVAASAPVGQFRQRGLFDEATA